MKAVTVMDCRDYTRDCGNKREKKERSTVAEGVHYNFYFLNPPPTPPVSAIVRAVVYALWAGRARRRTIAHINGIFNLVAPFAVNHRAPPNDDNCFDGNTPIMRAKLQNNAGKRKFRCHGYNNIVPYGRAKEASGIYTEKMN